MQVSKQRASARDVMFSALIGDRISPSAFTFAQPERLNALTDRLASEPSYAALLAKSIIAPDELPSDQSLLNNLRGIGYDVPGKYLEQFADPKGAPKGETMFTVISFDLVPQRGNIHVVGQSESLLKIVSSQTLPSSRAGVHNFVVLLRDKRDNGKTPELPLPKGFDEVLYQLVSTAEDADSGFDPRINEMNVFPNVNVGRIIAQGKPTDAIQVFISQIGGLDSWGAFGFWDMTGQVFIGAIPNAKTMK
jgi:hypothetical protein